MEALYLDMHIVVWLRQKELQKFSPKACESIEQAGQLFVSLMVELELKFLHEIGRISEIIQKVMLIDWSCNPFDRIIVVAHTMSQESKLLTED